MAGKWEIFLSNSLKEGKFPQNVDPVFWLHITLLWRKIKRQKVNLLTKHTFKSLYALVYFVWDLMVTALCSLHAENIFWFQTVETVSKHHWTKVLKKAKVDTLTWKFPSSSSTVNSIFAQQYVHPLSKVNWLELTGSKKLLMCGATVHLCQLHHASEVGDVRGHYSLPKDYWWTCWCVNAAGLWGDVLLFLFYFSAHTSKLI